MQRLFKKIHIDFKGTTHILSLDGIRGAGMITVMLYHFFSVPYAAWFSMDSFFVLSGFLITGILLDTKAGKQYFRNYIARRMLRILPLYYGVLIVFFIIVPSFVNKASLSQFSVYYQDQAYFWTYLQNWILLVKETQLKGTDRIFLHLWSLAIEEQFYIVWPYLVLLFNVKNFVRVILVLIAFSIGLKCYYFFSGYTWHYTYFNTFCRLDSLCIGGLIAIAVRNKAATSVLEKIVPYIFKISFVVLFAAILLLRPVAPKSQFLEPVGTTCFAIFFAAMILYCLSDNKKSYTKRILESKILLFFGRYSYSIYIFHVPILILLRPDLFVFFHKHFPSSIAFLMANFCCVVLTLLISQATWIFIEKPALKLKRFFKYEIKKPDSIIYHTTAVAPQTTIAH